MISLAEMYVLRLGLHRCHSVLQRFRIWCSSCDELKEETKGGASDGVDGRRRQAVREVLVGVITR